jgi:putative hydrolase of the HAD superfamily
MASTLPGACDIPECRHHQQLTDIANAIVLSCEAGYAKPDVRIYQAALRQLAVAPSDALFIDDTPGHVTAAESFGMAGCLHTSTADTITRIEDFLRPL